MHNNIWILVLILCHINSSYTVLYYNIYIYISYYSSMHSYYA